ncbi:MAG: presqualene diphosphate synthase HpnD [Verrucomicrobiota bacterium]
MQSSQAITRKSNSNLALAFVMLPREKRAAMASLYAFCREVDDVADEDTVPTPERRARLAAWRADLKLAYSGGKPQFPVNQELQPVIARYGLSFEHFDALILGCEMDLDTLRYTTLEELEKYCYHVASVVGLLSIRIFEYQNPACTDYAIYLGKALQLTNILRDVSTDANRGRIYLPLELLQQHQVKPADILSHQYSPGYQQVATTVATRARHYYQLARTTLPEGERRAMVAAELMGSVYWQLLKKLEQHRFDVFSSVPVKLSKGHKILLILRAWCRFMCGISQSTYGTP